jgi:hypothetical protein
MPVLHLEGPFHGFEFDTESMKLRTLEAMSQLAEHCVTDHDRKMLLMAFDIVSRVELREYE